MRILVNFLLSVLLCATPAMAVEKIQASSSSKIRGTGQAADGGLFGGIQKDTEYVARTNAIVDAVTRALEGQSDAVRKLFKDNWANPNSPDRRGADDFVSQQIVSDAPGSGIVDVNKKTRTVTYVFNGTLDLRRLLEILGGNEKSKLVPLIFYSMRETSEEQEQVFAASVTKEEKRLEEVEAKLAASDNGTLREEAAQLKHQIIEKRHKITGANKYKFSISDIGPRKAFGGQVKATLQDLGFDEFVDGALSSLSKPFNEANAAGEEPDPALLKEMTAESIKEDADYVIIMSLDFSCPKKIGLTGAYECHGTATGDVYKKPEGRRSARSVAALDPIIVKGRGSSEQEAKKEVAIMIAKDAAQDIAAKLRSNKRL